MPRWIPAPTWSALCSFRGRRGIWVSMPRACWASACAGARKKWRSPSMPAIPGSTPSLNSLQPDMLQLHGRELPGRVAKVKQRFGLPVIKAIAIETKIDLSAIEAYETVADRLLFDAPPPREATRPGGLGNTFDWHLLEDLETSVPFMLSGGLDAGNVGEALRITRAPGVDVSSGVERAPGEKDVDLIRAFVRAAREAAARHSAHPVAGHA